MWADRVVRLPPTIDDHPRRGVECQKGYSYHLPVAAGDPVPAAGRDVQTNRQTVAVTFFRVPSPASRFTTHVPVYDLTDAVGFWGPESSPEELG